MYASPSRSRCALLLRGERLALADGLEHDSRAIGDAAVQFAAGVVIEGAARRIGRVLVNAGHLERLAVVERRVAAAMMDDHRMVLRHLVEVVDVELALVLHLGVVEEISLDPSARRRLWRLGAQLVDDAVDGDELDLEGIADEHLVEQHVAAGVIVAVDEAGHDRHLLCVERLRSFAGQRLDLAEFPTATNRPPLTANASASGRARRPCRPWR